MLVFNHLQGRRLSPPRLAIDAVAVSAMVFLKKVAKYCNDRPAECRLRLAMRSAVSPPRSSSMPSPAARASRSALLAASAAVAVAPDLDILVGSHRTYTHSVGAVAIVGVAAWLVLRARPAGAAGRRRADRRVRVTSGARLDRARTRRVPSGLTALWPFTSHYYKSGLESVRRSFETLLAAGEFILGNIKAATWEFALLAPLLVSCLGILE